MAPAIDGGTQSEPEPFLTTEHTEQFGEISPDGHWFVYQSNESGKNEVWVTSFPTRDGKWLISEEGGILPRWSADGKEIFYLNQEHSSLFAAAVTTQGAAVQVLGAHSRHRDHFVQPIVITHSRPS